MRCSIAWAVALWLVWAPLAGHAQTRAGDEVYRTACVSCHGPDGRGQPTTTVGFEVALPDFTDCGFATPEAGADWHAIVEHGGPIRRFDRKMPAFKDALSAEEIDGVIGYVRGFCREPGWPHGDLNLPRALVTEKAFPENEAVVTTTVDRANDRSVGNSFVYEHRIGARSQYEVVVPFDVQRSEGGQWSHGLGDIALALKRTVVHSLRTGSILSAGGEVVFPTGKESAGLGGGVTMLEPFAAFSQILPAEGFLHVHAGFERSLKHKVANDEAYLRTAVGRSFTQPNGGRVWSPMVELLGAREFGNGERMHWDALPEVQVTLSRRQHVMVNIGVQFPLTERAERSRKAVAYLLWDWFDGGLFEGW